MNKNMLGLLGAAILTAACQSNSYKIEGVADGLNEGDVLYIAEDFTSTPIDTLVIGEGGKFSCEGTVDSLGYYMLFNDAHTTAVTFFLEPGNINIKLATGGDPTFVGGTKSNDGWQKMLDITLDFNDKAKRIANQLYDENIDSLKQVAIYNQFDSLQNDMKNKVYENAKQYMDCEFGAFVFPQMAYSDQMTYAQAQELLAMMPADMQKRKAVVEAMEMVERRNSTEIGQPMKDITLKTPNGEDFSVLSESNNNKITVLDFWASWCGPCRHEMPFMKMLYERYHEKGLGIVGISLDQDPAEWVKALEEIGTPWKQGRDMQEDGSSIAAQMFNVQAIPFIVVIDQKGTILNKDIRGEELEAFISEQLQ